MIIYNYTIRAFIQVIKIAHRGNFYGRQKSSENTLKQIEMALFNGFHVEIDIRLQNGQLFFGHEVPQETVDIDYLKHPSFWVHSKTFETHMYLCDHNIHCFFHDAEDYIFTSRGIKWCRAGVTTYDGIIVMPEYSPVVFDLIRNKHIHPLGVCSDDFSLLQI